MITVTAPDKTEKDFPDYMTDEQILQVMRKKFPSKKESGFMQLAKNISFEGMIGFGGQKIPEDVTMDSALNITDKFFQFHPAYARYAIAATGDMALQGAKDAITVLDRASEGDFGYIPILPDTRLLLEKGNLIGPVDEFKNRLKERLTKSMSTFKNSATPMERVAYDLTQASNSLILALGSTALTGNPLLPSLMFAAQQKAQTYDNLTAGGVKENEAVTLSNLNALTEAGLEMAGLHTWTRTLRGLKTVQRTIGRISTEVIQEVAQQGATEIFNQPVDNKTINEIVKELGYTAFIAAVTASPISTFQTVIENKGIIGTLRKANIPDDKIERILKLAYTQAQESTMPALNEAFPELYNEVINKENMDIIVNQGVPEVEANLESAVANAPLEISQQSFANESIGATDINITKQEILKSFGKEEKKYTESQVLRQSFRNVARWTNETVRLARKDLQGIKQELNEYIKTLPLESRGKFTTMLTNAKSEQDVLEGIERIDAEHEKIYRSNVIDLIQKSIKKFSKSESIDAATRSTLIELGNKLDFTSHRHETIERLESIRNSYLKRLEQGEPIGLSNDLFNAMHALYAQDINELSTDTLEATLKELNILTEAGRQKLQTSEQYREFKNNIKRNILTLAVNKNLIKKFGDNANSIYSGISEVWNKALKINRAITPMDFIFDLLDGEKNYSGPHMMLIKRPIDIHYQLDILRRQKFCNDVLKFVAEQNIDKKSSKRVAIYSLLKNNRGREIIEYMISEGTITELEVKESLTLTATEQNLYDMMMMKYQEMYPLVKDVLARVYNKTLGYVPSYAPIFADYSSIENLTTEDILSGKNFIVSPESIKASFIEKRKSGQVKVELDAIKNFTRYMTKASYLTTVGEILPDLQSIINEDYRKQAGDVAYTELKQWLNLLARQGGQIGQSTDLDTAMKGLRINVGLMRMGFQISSTMVQLSSLLPATTRLGQWVPAGLKEILKPEVRRFVLEYMPEIRERIGDDPSYMELYSNKIGHAGLYTLRMLDGVAASSTAYGALMKYADGLGKTISQLSEKELSVGLQIAQMEARLTQGSALFKDAASIATRGSISGNVQFDKLIAQFQNFAMTQWANMYSQVYTYGIKQGDYGKAAMTLALYSVAIMMQVASQELERDLYDYLFGSLPKRMRHEDPLREKFLKNALSQVPYMSPIMSVVAYNSFPIPAISAITDVVESTGYAAKKPDTIKVFVALSHLAGILGGAPTQLINDILRRLS